MSYELHLTTGLDQYSIYSFQNLQTCQQGFHNLHHLSVQCPSFNAHSPRVQAKSHGFGYFTFSLPRLELSAMARYSGHIWMNSRSWLHSVTRFSSDHQCDSLILWFSTLVTCLHSDGTWRIYLRWIWMLQARRLWDMPATWQDMGACRIDVY